MAETVVRTSDPPASSLPEENVSPERVKRLCPRCRNRLMAGKPLRCADCEDELRRSPAPRGEPSTVPPIVHEVVCSPGQPLDRSTRTFMESRFGHDLSGVRVHTDAQAAASARSVNALAYTVGRDIVFGSGQYRPGTAEGKRLLGHELAHVIQQGAGSQPGTAERMNEGATLRRQPAPAAAPQRAHRFTAEGVSVLVRTSCGRANFGYATVEAAVRDALDKIFNTECIAEDRRRQIQRNLTRHGLDFICRRSASIGDSCARAEGYFVPANQIAIGSAGFPGHPEYDAAGCGPLASSILHEIVHITRGFYPEALPASCEASCYGFGSASPALCQSPIVTP